MTVPIERPRPVIANDPIRAERELRRFEFVRNRLPVAADGAIVLLTSSGTAKCFSPKHQPTRGELVSGNFRTLYEVDTGYHRITIEHDLPSDGDAFFFHAEVDFTWRVV